MAGDWIKMRSNLWDDPRVARIVDATDTSEAAVVGALYWLWATADQHTEDGVLSGMSLRALDRKTGVQGFGAALVAIGWLAEHSEGVQVVRFEEHNGKSAKRRCSESVRKMSARDADKTQTSDGQKEDDAPQSCAPREREREREEVNHSVAKATGDKSPMSPDEIIFGYGVPLLVSGGSSDKSARSFLGGLRKHHGDDALINTLRECLKAKPLQPTEWLAAALPPNGQPRAGPSRMPKPENFDAIDYGTGGRL
jgi:hypothetical protein